MQTAPLALDSKSAMNRPQIRIVHHLARSGGTLISRCLGCMKDVVLLSEVNPIGLSLARKQTEFEIFDPLLQAMIWHGLFTQSEFKELRASSAGENFQNLIELIALRVIESGKTLVLRDWTHLDFTAVPFLRTPSYRLACAESLSPKFNLMQATTVRHPIDQWISLTNYHQLDRIIGFQPFLESCHQFARVASRVGFIRYEDFVRSPFDTLQKFCERLQIPFDPTFLDNWHTYESVTGDPPDSRGRSNSSIRWLPRRPGFEKLYRQFEKNRDYRNTIELLGYSHPE